MVRRIRESKVRPEQRQEWLRRYEAGESPPQIAKDTRVDVRTVRRHIREAMQENERREARFVVLRSALEQHYADLIEFAKQLESQAKGQRAISVSLEENRMWLALKQHLPRTPLWSYLNKRNSLLEELTRLEKNLEKRLKTGVKSDSRLKGLRAADMEQIASGIAEALVLQTKSKAKGETVLELARTLAATPLEQGNFLVLCGPHPIGKGEKELLEIVKQIVEEKEPKITRWKEYGEFSRLFQELDRVNQNLSEELAVIILRRVVPGRCIYCPV